MNNSAGVDAACNLIDIHLLYILYCLRRIGTLLEYIPLASRSPLSCGYMGYSWACMAQNALSLWSAF